MARSATVVWCPHCKEWTGAESINASDYGEANDRHLEEDGIRYHQRFRRCTECGETFWTAELDYDELHRLLDDRAKLIAVRKAMRTKR